MTIKVYLHAIREEDRYISLYISLTENERERKVVEYCLSAWPYALGNREPIPDTNHAIIKHYFDKLCPAETLHYDTDWLRPEDFAACPHATVIDDSVLLTPQPK